MLYRIQKERAMHGLPMERYYSYAGISRQAYYKRLQRKDLYDRICNELSGKVLSYRAKKDARAGSRSLFKNLDIKSEYGIGINKFEHMMREMGLTMKPLRTRIVTTKSSFQSWQYSNLISGLEITDINQVIAGDLTYVDIGRDRWYTFCLTDLYSARIVGIEINNRMRSIEAFSCQQQWVELRGKENLQGCIHHTDGGSQYFSNLYLGGLQPIGVQVSVANNCLENGYSEQQNSMLKNHFIPTINYYPGMNISLEIKRISDFYNRERKQPKLGWLSPVAFEQKWHKKEGRPKIKLHDFNE